MTKKICIFFFLFSLVFIIGCLFSFVGPVQGKTNTFPVSEEELLRWKDGLTERKNELYIYAIKIFNSPIKFDGRKDKDGSTYYKLIFSSGNEFVTETYPGVGGINRLLAPKGFDNEQEAFITLQKYAKSIKLKVDWRKPKEENEGDERTVSFEENDQDLNAIPSMVYKKGKLVEIAFSLAP